MQGVHIRISNHIKGRTCQEGTIEEFTDSKSHKVTEYSEGKTVQRRHRTKNKIVEDSIEFCQEGIEKVQGVHRRTLF